MHISKKYSLNSNVVSLQVVFLCFKKKRSTEYKHSELEVFG